MGIPYAHVAAPAVVKTVVAAAPDNGELKGAVHEVTSLVHPYAHHGLYYGKREAEADPQVLVGAYPYALPYAHAVVPATHLPTRLTLPHRRHQRCCHLLCR